MSISSPFPHHPLLPLLEKHNTNVLHIKQIHAQALKTSPSPSPSLSIQENNPLLFLYSRLIYHSSVISTGGLSYARKLLDHPLAPSLPPNSFCFNSLIRASSRRRSLLNDEHSHLSLCLYRRMLSSGTNPDNHTFPFILRACAFLFAYSFGCQIHSYIIKLGFSSDVYVSNSLVHFYSSCGELTLARRVFDQMLTRNQVSWNAVIDAYSSAGGYEVALELFRSMMREGMVPDGYTMQSALCACAGLGCLSLGLWAHAFMMNKCSGGNKDVLDDVLINNSLFYLYSKCGAFLGKKGFLGVVISPALIQATSLIIIQLTPHQQLSNHASST